MTTWGASSEVGRLRTVMLHRPGQELARLTPRNNDSLLFDGIPWLGRAQDEHDAFAQALRDHDVEVLYLVELLVETLEQPEARAEILSDPAEADALWRAAEFSGSRMVAGAARARRAALD